jgi:PiT family inorganic phosphate transporter
MAGEFSLGLILVLFLVLVAEFVNGWTDAPNAIATVVSTRVLSPSKAVLLATLLNIAGALSGTAVAATIGKGIVESSVINLATIGAAMVAIVTWSTFAWRLGLPTSETHALVSGLAGAGLATAGPDVLL